jgi:hypothetical protein
MELTERIKRGLWVGVTSDFDAYLQHPVVTCSFTEIPCMASIAAGSKFGHGAKQIDFGMQL